MKKRVALSAVTAMCGISAAYCTYRKKIHNPYMSKKEVQTFISTHAQPYGKNGNVHPENIVLSRRCSLGTDPAHTGINGNILILGGSWSERKELAQANLLQRNGSYIVMDPSGELLATTGAFFDESGYEIKVLNLADQTNSMHYNPLRYLEEESDVRMVARYLLEMHSFDQMDIKAAELALLEALILYIRKFQPAARCTLSSIYRAIEKIMEDPSAMTYLLDEVAVDYPEDLCLKRYRHFMELSKYNQPEIIADIKKRLSYLDSEEIIMLTADDEMDLRQVPDKPTIIYILTGAKEEPSGWLCGMLVTQMIDILCRVEKGRDLQTVKYSVRFLLDNFCQTPIQGFPGRLSSNRRLLMHEASFLLFTGDMSEVNHAYHDDLELLLFACDTVLCYQSALIKSGRDIARLWGGKCVKMPYRKAASYRIISRFNENDFRKVGPEQVAIIIRGMKLIRDARFRIEDHLDAKRLNTTKSRGYSYTHAQSACQQSSAPVTQGMESRKEGEA